MAVFDGTSRRRQINLGGNRVDRSREDVLRHAEQARARREAARKQATAASCLQQAWRRYSRRGQVRRMLLQDVNADNSAGRVAVSFVLPVVSQESEIEALLMTAVGAPPAPSLLPLRLSDILNNYKRLGKLCLALLVDESVEPEWVPKIATAVINWAASTDAWSAPNLGPVITRLARVNATEVISVLARRTEAASHAPIDSTSDFSGIGSISGPVDLNATTILIQRLKTQPRAVSALVERIDAFPTDETEQLRNSGALNGVCTPSSIRAALTSLSSEEASRYFLDLLRLAPAAKTDILMQLSLASTPSPLSKFWHSFTTTPLFKHGLDGPAAVAGMGRQAWSEASLLGIVIEMYSYWMLIASDDDILSNKSGRGLDLTDLGELTRVLRNLCFVCAWQWPRLPSKLRQLPLFALLRQIYARDSRRSFLPPDFWLMESYMGPINVASASIDVSANQNSADADSDDEDLGTNSTAKVLRTAPFFIAFTTRVKVLRELLNRDTQIQMSRPPANFGLLPSFSDDDWASAEPWAHELPMIGAGDIIGPFSNAIPGSRRHYEIKRENLIEDAQSAFEELGSRVRTDLAVRFRSQGLAEAGIDGGGLTKEILTTLCQAIFGRSQSDDEHPEYSEYRELFQETDAHTLTPNSRFGEREWQQNTPQDEIDLVRRRYVFLGQIVAKCLYENLLIDVEFAPFFLAKWSGAAATRLGFDDLFLLDESLYRSLLRLHDANVDDLALDFTTVGTLGQSVELRPHGAEIPVTNANKLEYIRELAHYKLNVVLAPQTRWFLEGMAKVISLDWLKMFNAPELQTLLSGRSHDFNVDDLRANSEVMGFGPNIRVADDLFSVLKEFTPEQRGEFLKFVTSVPRAPLLGFKQLNPHFGVRSAGFDDQRLPTASTCVNLLKLPEYSTREILKEKLLYSIEARAGFDLS